MRNSVERNEINVWIYKANECWWLVVIGVHFKNFEKVLSFSTRSTVQFAALEKHDATASTKLVAISRGYWNKWSAKLESDRFFLLVPWYFHSQQKDIRKFRICAVNMSKTHSTAHLRFSFSVQSTRWEQKPILKLSLHRLLDYGDYEEMKEFSIFIKCTATAAVAMVTSTTATTTPTMLASITQVKMLQCFSSLCDICHK